MTAGLPITCSDRICVHVARKFSLESIYILMYVEGSCYNYDTIGSEKNNGFYSTVTDYSPLSY